MPLTNQNQECVAKAAKRREIFFRYFTLLSCICLMIQIISIPYKIHRFTSLSNMTLLILWSAVWCYTMISQLTKKVTTSMVSLMFIVLLSVLSFGISLIFNSGLLSQAGKLLGFLALPMMIYVIRSFPVSDKTRRLVLISNIAVSGEYIFLYNSPLRHVFVSEYGTKNISSVTLGFPNPNQTAIMLFVCCVLLFISLFFFENKVARALIFADLVYVAYIMFETDSRTAVLLLAVFVVLSLVSFKKRLPKIITSLSLISPAVYLLLAMTAVTALDFIQIGGHNIFTGRQNIYAKYFDNLNVLNFLFGDFDTFRFENLHNGYIAIAATTGIVVLIAYYVFLRKTLMGARGVLDKKYESAAYCGLLCLMIYICTEAGLVVGGAMYAYLIAMVFFMMPAFRDDTPAVSEKI